MSKRTLLASIAAFIFLVSCKKQDLNLLPQPVPVATPFVQFNVGGIPLTGNQLYAMVSIKKSSGEAVFTNKKITLNYHQGMYKTDKIQLNKADYKLSKLIVLSANDTAVYAAPMVNSARAPSVNNPLDISFSVSNGNLNSVPVEVLKINESDAAASYGYTDSDFGFVAYMTVRVKLKVNVGQVSYDSLAGLIRLTATNSQGDQWYRELNLQKGITSLRVPHQYATYEFKVSKWNTTAQVTLSGSAIQSNMEINLEAFRQPKKLIEESVYIENSAGLVPDSRTEFFYNANNFLSLVKNYQRSTQVSGLPLTNIYHFIYTGTLLDSIHRFDAANNNTGYTAFLYDAGKISNIANQSYDQFTGGSVTHTYINGFEKIKTDYLYQNGNSMEYTMNFIAGNKVSDQAITSNYSSESGIYEYDDFINPKHQLGYPDLYFTNVSKNNVVYELKNYAGAVPQVVPYKFEYLYDNDGYPSEVFISYKGYSSQQHLYRIKKVYTYQ